MIPHGNRPGRQRPTDGDGAVCGKYAIPAQEAPTEASTRTVATERFLADLNSHKNEEAWSSTAIRSVRFMDHLPAL